MPLILRQAEAADRPAFQRLIASVAGLEAYEDTAIERLTRHAFGPNAFVTVVLAE